MMLSCFCFMLPVLTLPLVTASAGPPCVGAANRQSQTSWGTSYDFSTLLRAYAALVPSVL